MEIIHLGLACSSGPNHGYEGVHCSSANRQDGSDSREHTEDTLCILSVGQDLEESKKKKEERGKASTYLIASYLIPRNGTKSS